LRKSDLGDFDIGEFVWIGGSSLFLKV
jgi:hypothetical protein